MSFGLSDDVLARIQAIFAHFPVVERVLLYGSRAKGNYRTGSDIDLTFIGDGLDQRMLGLIAEELDELLLPYRFDLSIFSAISHAELREHIERVGMPFYEKKLVAREVNK